MSKNVMLYGGPKDGAMVVVEDYRRSLDVPYVNWEDIRITREPTTPQMLDHKIVVYRETSPRKSPFDFAIFEVYGEK